MDSKARRKLGEDTYRSVMQTEPPEVRSVLTAKMLDLEFAELWNRELLTRKERRWITLACLASPERRDPHPGARVRRAQEW